MAEKFITCRIGTQIGGFSCFALHWKLVKFAGVLTSIARGPRLHGGASKMFLFSALFVRGAGFGGDIEVFDLLRFPRFALSAMKSEQILRCSFGVTCRYQNCAVVTLQHGKPAVDVSCVIGAWARRSPQLGREKCAPKFGDQFLHRIGGRAKSTCQVAIQAMLCAGPMH
ncbi:MAG: hypothetical protein R3C30_01310 [Hyphomonadaceae bacterium]